MSEFKVCPFCGVEPYDVVPNFDGMHRMVCPTCEALGPECFTREAAIVAWGMRFPGWKPIETAPNHLEESKPFLIRRRGIAIQVSWFEGRMYPDAREAAIDWDDGILDATHWMPLP